MTDMNRDAVEEKLKAVIDPHTGKDLVAAKAVKDIAVNGDGVKIDIVLGYPARSWEAELAGMVRAAVAGAEVSVASDTVAHEVQEGVRPLPGVKNIIAVASG
ncbi:MAG: iron-sulfur cluster assembly protein, partial [Gammaproteobacteria bacterium]|nr:iron-sulfur cluster assembly protein [Gammaproteobacteria bacterium]MDD9874669.1 iron-sulfur cluster assembly protein [Gammaproteobacteria bacterium]